MTTLVAIPGLCDLSWLPPSMCAHCRGDQGDPPQLGLAVRPRLPLPEPDPIATTEGLRYVAARPTSCTYCSRTIRAGESMTRDVIRNANACERCLP